MGLNETPASERTHIGFFGCVNVGKSSLVNALTGQNTALVSEEKGTTTDPVKKAMELLPLGPVLIIDTAGFEDDSNLGSIRMEKTMQILNSIHIGILVTEAGRELNDTEKTIQTLFEDRKLPYLIVCNKADVADNRIKAGEKSILVSAKTGENIEYLKERIGQLQKKAENKRLAGDLVSPLDQVVLVVPIDKAAPKGRLILPQQQTIRDLLEEGCRISVCRDRELKDLLDGLKQPPALVITDSQVFEEVAQIVPESIPLTSFSILFARYKGSLDRMTEGAFMLDQLKDHDKVLISEGCTHRRQCGDIGSEKLPAWIREFTGKEIDFTFTSGGEFKEDLSSFSLIIHCGGCMLNEKEMQYRMQKAMSAGVPVTNYGTVIAHIKGILARSLKIFG